MAWDDSDEDDWEKEDLKLDAKKDEDVWSFDCLTASESTIGHDGQFHY